MAIPASAGLQDKFGWGGEVETGVVQESFGSAAEHAGSGRRQTR